MDVFEPTVTIRTYVPDSIGLGRGSDVRLNGMLAGEVRSVGLSGSPDPQKRIEVAIALKRRLIAIIPDDSTASITADVLGDDKTVNITKGKSPRPVEPGGVLISPPVVDFDQAELIKSVNAMLAKVDAALADIESGNGSLGKFFKGNDYDKWVGVFRRFQNQAAGSTFRTSPAGQLLYDDAIYRQLRASIKRIDDQMIEMQAGRGQAGRWLKETADYDQLRKSVASLDRSLRALESGGSGKFLKDDAMYVGMVKQTEHLIQAVDALQEGRGTLGEMMVSTQLYESLDGSLRNLQASIADFRTNPKKYLWVKIF
jgi:phospholipid/cholesterol/gamma-HCH transport system substrate-binding protein